MHSKATPDIPPAVILQTYVPEICTIYQNQFFAAKYQVVVLQELLAAILFYFDP